MAGPLKSLKDLAPGVFTAIIRHTVFHFCYLCMYDETYLRKIVLAPRNMPAVPPIKSSSAVFIGCSNATAGQVIHVRDYTTDWGPATGVSAHCTVPTHTKHAAVLTEYEDDHRVNTHAPLHIDLVPLAVGLRVVLVRAKVAVLPVEPNPVMGRMALKVICRGTLNTLSGTCRRAAPENALARMDQFWRQ